MIFPGLLPRLSPSTFGVFSPAEGQTRRRILKEGGVFDGDRPPFRRISAHLFFRWTAVVVLLLSLGIGREARATVGDVAGQVAPAANKPPSPQTPAPPKTAPEVEPGATIGQNGVAAQESLAEAKANLLPESLSFYIREFRVFGLKQIPGGESLLSPKEIQAAVYPFLGPYRTKDDVAGARQALLEAYQIKGYQTVHVEIPQQRLLRGVVYLKVEASTVGRIRVNGSRFYDLTQIKSELPDLKPGTVPNFTLLPQDLVGLNSLADRQITPGLKPGVVPETIDVNLNVKDHFPVHGTLEFNNRYSANTTDYRATATASYDNLFQLGHSLSASYSVAPMNEADSEVYSLSYLARIPNVPWLSYLVYGLKSNSDVSVVGNLDVIGIGETIGVRQLMTLPTQPEDKGFFHTLSLGVDLKKYDETLNSLNDNIVTKTPVTYFPISATYSANWQHRDGSSTALNAGLTFNLRGVGSNLGEFDSGRYGGNGDFFYARGDLAHTQELPARFQLYNHVQGQVADQPLLSGEQINAGGLDTVRGYLEAEVLGDNGGIGTMELRTPSLSPWLGSKVNEWRFYEFCDAGIVASDQTLNQQVSQYELASVGVGSKAEFINHLYGSADLAFPLLSATQTNHDAWRLTFRLWATF